LDIISGWSLSEGKSAVYSKMDEKGEMIKIMIVSRKIHSSMSRSDEYEQIAYIGKDVTAMYNGMQKATYALILLGVLAIIVASVAGYLMSGKAFVPLKQAYEKQRQFAADASHELRTPLAVVMASAEILASDPSIKSPFLKQVIEDVHDEVKKMTKLVSDLLVVARSDNNQLRLKLSKFDMSALIDQTMRQMQPLAEKKKITIIALPSTKTMIRADEQKIKQLMTILVDNAIKYTPEKGIVTMFLEKHDRSRLIFGVMDTGIGIAAEDQAKIFDRFFRVDKVRSREMGGNGLGLAIAREIVGLHKGKITVQSKPGDGTKFIIELNDNLKGKTVQAPIAESDALGIAD